MNHHPALRRGGILAMMMPPAGGRPGERRRNGRRGHPRPARGAFGEPPNFR